MKNIRKNSQSSGAPFKDRKSNLGKHMFSISWKRGFHTSGGYFHYVKKIIQKFDGVRTGWDSSESRWDSSESHWKYDPWIKPDGLFSRANSVKDP